MKLTLMKKYQEMQIYGKSRKDRPIHVLLSILGRGTVKSLDFNFIHLFRCQSKKDNLAALLCTLVLFLVKMFFTGLSFFLVISMGLNQIGDFDSACSAVPKVNIQLQYRATPPLQSTRNKFLNVYKI